MQNDDFIIIGGDRLKIKEDMENFIQQELEKFRANKKIQETVNDFKTSDIPVTI